ncbi:MAG: metal ABC transporter permease [Thermoflexus sp.]|nr:metal ABC transporter permease [Thermoflexus sp.]
MILELFRDPTFWTVALGSSLLGGVAGALGVFAVLRRESLIGDVMSHAALPGIVLAFLITGSRELPPLLLGAALSAGIGALLAVQIPRRSRIKPDAALGLVLSVFFGIGIVGLTVAQQRPTAAQAGLDRFLFGQAATMLRRDVAAIALAALLVLAFLLLLWKEWKLLAFDPVFARACGLPVGALEALLAALMVLTVAIGLPAVGVVLMSALLVAPAAAARQWTDRLERMVVLAGGFGALSGGLGTLMSAGVGRLPTGPLIVLMACGMALLSLLIAPRRGILRRRRTHARPAG